MTGDIQGTEYMCMLGQPATVMHVFISCEANLGVSFRLSYIGLSSGFSCFYSCSGKRSLEIVICVRKDHWIRYLIQGKARQGQDTRIHTLLSKFIL